MKFSHFVLFLLLCLWINQATAQTITKIDHYQDNKNIIITYSVSGLKVSGYYDFTLYCSTDDGFSWSAPLTQLTGDVGKIQANTSTKAGRIVWAVLAERPEGLVADKVRFKVVATYQQPETPEEKAWRINSTLNICDSYKSYLATYSNGKFAAQAHTALEQLGCLPPPTYTDPTTHMDFIYVPGGTFTMGSTDGESDEKPTHEVTVSSFYMGKYEVTQAQWRAVMGTDPSELYFKGCDSCPVERVSWNDIQDFLKKLNARSGKIYRLPTEAEWEYAAGGGGNNRTKYAGTNTENELGEYAWYTSNSNGTTHPVGEKKANGLGIYDMNGNVWEWCSDWYGTYESGGQTNPKGPANGFNHVNRGGSWYYYASICRVAYRSTSSPDSRDRYLGFRLALVP